MSYTIAPLPETLRLRIEHRGMVLYIVGNTPTQPIISHSQMKHMERCFSRIFDITPSHVFAVSTLKIVGLKDKFKASYRGRSGSVFIPYGGYHKEEVDIRIVW